MVWAAVVETKFADTPRVERPEGLVEQSGRGLDQPAQTKGSVPIIA